LNNPKVRRTRKLTTPSATRNACGHNENEKSGNRSHSPFQTPKDQKWPPTTFRATPPTKSSITATETKQFEAKSGVRDHLRCVRKPGYALRGLEMAMDRLLGEEMVCGGILLESLRETEPEPKPEAEAWKEELNHWVG